MNMPTKELSQIGSFDERQLLKHLRSIKAPQRKMPIQGIIAMDADNTFLQNQHSCMSLHSEVQCVNDMTEAVASPGTQLPHSIIQQRGVHRQWDDLVEAKLKDYTSSTEIITYGTDTGLNALCCFNKVRSPNGGAYLGPHDLFFPNALLLVATIWILHHYGYYCINGSQRVVIPAPAKFEFMLAALDTIFGADRFFLTTADTRLLRLSMNAQLQEYFEMSNLADKPDKTMFLQRWNDLLFGKIPPRNLALVDDCKSYRDKIEANNMRFILATNEPLEPYKSMLATFLVPAQIMAGINAFLMENPALNYTRPKLQNLISTPPKVKRKPFFSWS